MRKCYKFESVEAMRYGKCGKCVSDEMWICGKCGSNEIWKRGKCSKFEIVVSVVNEEVW